MATVTKNGALLASPFGGVPYGNATAHRFNLTTNASGVMTDSNQTTALVQTDKVRLGILPAGFEIHDSLAIVSDAFTASSTLKLGWEYVDGTDVTATPQDDDYFHAALAINAVGRTRANNTAVAPVIVPKAVYIIGTVAGADLAAVGILDFIVYGVDRGQP